MLAIAFDWRVAAIALAVLAFILVAPVLVLVRNDPSEVGERPLGAPDGPVRPPPPPDAGVMRRATRSSDFWFLAGTFFVCGATSNGLIGQHFIPHAVEHGFTQSAAASALALMGVFNFIGTIASGWLTDRYDPRKLLLIYYGFRGISLLFLPFVHDAMTIGAFAILFGLDYIATVPPTVALAADRFGAHNVGVVYGWIFAAHMLGAAIAAWVAGVVRESVGDYADRVRRRGLDRDRRRFRGADDPGASRLRPPCRRPDRSVRLDELQARSSCASTVDATFAGAVMHVDQGASGALLGRGRPRRPARCPRARSAARRGSATRRSRCAAPNHPRARIRRGPCRCRTSSRRRPRAVVVLEGARHDLRRGRAALVDQHDQRQVGPDASGDTGVAFSSPWALRST